MLIFLKITGLTLAFLLGVLVVLLIIPLAICLEHSDGLFTVRVRVLLFSITLIPGRDKKKKKEPKKTKRPKKETKGQGLANIVKKKSSLIKPAVGLLKKLCRHISIRRVRIRLIVSGSTPSDTGVTAGRIWAGINASKAIIDSAIRVRYKSVRVIPDFTGECRGKGEFGCNIVVVPVILLADVLVFLYQLLVIMRSEGRHVAGTEPAGPP